jgi:hypothetical protein
VPDEAVICTPLPVDSGASADDATDSDGDSSVDAASDGARDATVETAAMDAPAEFEAPPGSGSTNACRIVHDEVGIESVCAPAGRGAERDFCRSDADCKPGLGCVGSADVGQCLAYCCASTTASEGCAPKHYCTPLTRAARPDDRVPVCALIDGCPLLADPELTCLSGSTCTVVTNKGETACVPLGSGRELDPCPCDRGYFCAGPTDARLCRKLCTGSADCRSGESCQFVPTLPAGFGLCAATSMGEKGR